jgi:hypothetical protein
VSRLPVPPAPPDPADWRFVVGCFALVAAAAAVVLVDWVRRGGAWRI